MITTIHEHSYDPSLLPERANILDLGCRGFLFTNYMTDLFHHVVPVDADALASDQPYLMCAVTDYNGWAEIIRNDDLQATRVRKVLKMNELDSYIHCYTIQMLSDVCGVEIWDLIKMDIEGSEYEVIMSLEKAPAKQLSIEFHLHTGVYKQHEMDLMESKLKNLGYYPAKHEMTSEHGAGMNYWDSLFILK